MKYYRRSRFLNTVINKAPFKLHIAIEYRFCGSNKKLKEHLDRGDQLYTGIA